MLSIDGVSFRYGHGGDELFDGLSHRFEPGKVTALTGPSGRGKSTLLYIIGLMLTPARGTVTLDGVTISDMSDASRARVRATRMGFVFQDASLDPSRTVLESVIEPALYAGWRKRSAQIQARALLDQFGVAARADHRPGEVSGGQAQRVAVARALINDPVVVLADEPTGNLDHDNAATVIHSLREATGGGRTVVIATHDPFVLERSDVVVAL